MSIQVLSFDHLLALLKESIEIGKKHYLVLLIGSIIMTTCNLILALTPMGSIANPILTMIWTVGIIFVAQTIIEKKVEPQVPQYFVAFSKTSLLKALVPAFIVIFVVSIVLALAAGIVGYATATLFSPHFPISQISSFATVLVGAVVMVPLTFLPYLVLLQSQHWKVALQKSVETLLKNKILIGIFAIPQVAITILMPIASYLVTLVVLLIAPLIMAFTYLIYKRLFPTDKPDLDITSVKH